MQRRQLAEEDAPDDGSSAVEHIDARFSRNQALGGNNGTHEVVERVKPNNLSIYHD